MGVSWSSDRRRNQNYYDNHRLHPPPSQQFAPSSSSSTYSHQSEPYPAPPSFSYPTPPPPPLSGPPVPSPPLPSPVYNPYNYSSAYNACNYSHPMMAGANFRPYYSSPNNGWAGIRPPPLPLPALPPVPYIDHQNAKKIRNDINVHKDTLQLEIDEPNPDHHLISFVFDALLDGNFTIYYAAREESNCRFVPLFPDAYMPVNVPFQKGVHQKFCQPSGTGIDLGFFELDELSKPSATEDMFPLVISAETCFPSTEESLNDPSPSSSTHRQITQAVVQKNDETDFQVKVIRQILWIDGVRYELRDIYGIGNSVAESFKDEDPGKECVICLTEPKDTAVLPCRHMCMCSGCAKSLRIQSNKCPICRHPIEELIEIKINKTDQ